MTWGKKYFNVSFETFLNNNINKINFFLSLKCQECIFSLPRNFPDDVK